MSYASHHKHSSRNVGVAILTVSDTKGPATDTSGDAIAKHLVRAGHLVTARRWAPDEATEIRGAATELLGSPETKALIVTGGTGTSPRDVTVETLRPLFTKELPGFGEYLRALSSRQIGSGAILSGATAGFLEGRAGRCPTFLLPGAPEACILAVEKIIAKELGHLVDLANPEGPPHA